MLFEELASSEIRKYGTAIPSNKEPSDLATYILHDIIDDDG